MAKYIEASISVAAWIQAESIMELLPLQLHTQIVTKALKKAIKPFVDESKKIVKAEHDSDVTGTGAKQSAKVREQRAGDKHLWQTITNRVRTYSNWTTMALAGPAYAVTGGNLINFWTHEKQHYLWGKTYYGVLPMFDSFERAAVQTESEQQSIFISELMQQVGQSPLLHLPGSTP